MLWYREPFPHWHFPLSLSLEYCFRLEWKVSFCKRLASRLGSYLLVLKLPAKLQPSTVVEIRM